MAYNKINHVFRPKADGEYQLKILVESNIFNTNYRLIYEKNYYNFKCVMNLTIDKELKH